jgi:hypothetical protein
LKGFLALGESFIQEVSRQSVLSLTERRTRRRSIILLSDCGGRGTVSRQSPGGDPAHGGNCHEQCWQRKMQQTSQVELQNQGRCLPFIECAASGTGFKSAEFLWDFLVTRQGASI